jgi:2-polyprenyl-3-methyl-5-hydroxy-6-metoxy-1,4-benzoquinol methylase
MLLTMTATPPADADWPATDLGFLLHKNPSRAQAFDVSYGRAHVFYPVATPEVCTAALLLEVDPVGLVRGGKDRNTPDFTLGNYVNDRPYAASSLLAGALGKVFRTALHGRCDQRPELAAAALPLRVEIPALICRDTELASRLFEPLGWTVEAAQLPLDPAFPEWGPSRYVHLVLTGELRLADALSHLYVILPALDGSKHYWVSTDEVDKLVRVGEGWLAGHPERGLITRRYLARRQSLVREALARLAEIDDVAPEALDNAVEDSGVGAGPVIPDGEGGAARSGVAEAGVEGGSGVAEARVEASAEAAVSPDADVDVAATEAGAEAPSEAETEAETETETADTDIDAVTDDPPAHAEARRRKESLAKARRKAVLTALRDVGAARVLDLGCGEGALVRDLLKDRAVTEIVGVDVSARALQIAARKLRLDRLPERVAARLTLRQGALTYTDARLAGYDAAVLMEVIEHVDLPRLGALEHSVFAAAHPAAVVVTTPNCEYNVRYETLEAGRMRHSDHRFEWTRAEFRAWADRVAAAHGYAVEYRAVGEEDPELGPSTQLALFTLATRATGRTELAEEEATDV